MVCFATPYRVCHKIYQITRKEKKPNTLNLELQMHLMKRYLKWYFRCHGETVSDDGLFFCGATFPAVQLNAAAAWQKNLLVHLHRRVPGKLASCTPQRNKQHLRLHRSPKYHGVCIRVSRARHEKTQLWAKSHPPATIRERITSAH